MRFVALAALGAAIVLGGCGPEVVGPRNSETARLRLASTSPDAGGLDLLVNGRTVARGVGSTGASTPAVVEPGTTTGQIRASGTTATLASVPLELAAGKSYTVLVAGPRSALTAMVSVDTGSGLPPGPAPTPGEPVDSGNPPPSIPDVTRFRIVHAASHAPPLDPYLLPAGAPLDTLPTLQPFSYGSLALTADLLRRPGHYVVKFTEAGTTHVVLDSGDIDAAANELLTVVLGENGDRTLRVDVVR